MNVHVTACLCLSLTACAFPFGGEIRPASNVVNPEAVTPREGAGAIVVTREWQLRDMDCIYDVVIDNDRVAELRTGEEVTVYPDPGKRVLGIMVRPEDDDCEAAIAQVPLQVVAYATTRVRVRAEGYYRLRIEATTF